MAQTWCLTQMTQYVIEKVKDASGGGLEYVFEAVGEVEAIELAHAVTGRGGTTTGRDHRTHPLFGKPRPISGRRAYHQGQLFWQPHSQTR